MEGYDKTENWEIFNFEIWKIFAGKWNKRRKKKENERKDRKMTVIKIICGKMK